MRICAAPSSSSTQLPWQITNITQYCPKNLIWSTSLGVNVYMCICVLYMHVYVSEYLWAGMSKSKFVCLCMTLKGTRKQVAFLAVNPCFFYIFPIHEIFTQITMRLHQLFKTNLHTPQSTVTCAAKWISVYRIIFFGPSIMQSFTFLDWTKLEWCRIKPD